MNSANGKVYLIGAGPGDVELLTLKAARVLGLADVVLLDDLVSRDILQFTQPNARVIEVGKRGGCKSTPQAFIEKLMLRFARRGATVARVKGGDPFVFGRGGEEMQTLQRAGIEVEIINGITSGIAAPAALGIPVTHRDCSRGVTFITGHTRDGAPPNWRALAESGTTLVIYMGMTNLASIVDSLCAAGMAKDMPAAVIQNAMNKNQNSVITTLKNLPEAVKRAGLGSPSIVVIGEVVNLANVMQQATENYIAA
jgi:uroporphyrin-III C-methyltransferase